MAKAADETEAKCALFRDVLKKHGMCENEGNLQFEVLDGSYINEVYKVSNVSSSSNAVVIKHALPYIKFLGPGHVFATRRQRIEHEALVLFHGIAQGICPKPIFFDVENDILCIEFLCGYESLRVGLRAGSTHLDTVQSLARNLALLHRQTHVNNFGLEELRKLEGIFLNIEMLHFHENFLFVAPMEKNNPQNCCSPAVMGIWEEVYGNDSVLTAVENVRRMFMEKKDCLIHGDLHSGSVMVNGTSTKILDLETARVGPCAYDVGVVLSYLLLAYHRHMAAQTNRNCHEKFAFSMIRASSIFMNMYFKHTDMFQSESSKAQLIGEIAGFVGCHFLKLTLGIYTDFLMGEDVDPQAETNTLRAGIRLLEQSRDITNIETLVNIATNS